MSTFTTLKYTYLSKYACSKLAQKRLMLLQDGPRVTRSERLAAIPTRLSHWHSHKKHMNLVQVFAMSRFCWIVPYYVRKLKNLCMITKLQYTCLNGQCRYACSTVAQQRLMRQDGPRVTHPSPQNATGMQPSALGGFTTHAPGTTIQLVVSRLHLQRETCTNGYEHRFFEWPALCIRGNSLWSCAGRQSRGGRFTMIYQDMTVQQRTLWRHPRHLI